MTAAIVKCGPIVDREHLLEVGEGPEFLQNQECGSYSTLRLGQPEGYWSQNWLSLGGPGWDEGHSLTDLICDRGVIFLTFTC